MPSSNKNVEELNEPKETQVSIKLTYPKQENQWNNDSVAPLKNQAIKKSGTRKIKVGGCCVVLLQSADCGGQDLLKYFNFSLCHICQMF